MEGPEDVDGKVALAALAKGFRARCPQSTTDLLDLMSLHFDFTTSSDCELWYTYSLGYLVVV